MSLLFHATRLAPSPTGALHLGHARTFLLTWWLARQVGARVSMRMEDLDLGRAKPQSVRQAYEDLRWLGMDWDPQKTQKTKLQTRNPEEEIQNTKPETPNKDDQTRNQVVQSERLELYRATLQSLWEKDAIYPCTCSRARIAASVAGAASAPHVGDPQVRYPGTCAGTGRSSLQAQSLDEAAAKVRAQTASNICWRLRVPPGTVAFEDVIAGSQVFDVAGEVGDFPLTRFDQTPAYQLACVVDDHAMGIDLVVRGDDLLSSTPRQMCLYQTMGWHPPLFAHVPLVIGPDGKRLAKRHGESRIAQFRAAGVTPQRVVGWAAWRTGQLEAPREIAAWEMIRRFDLAKLPRQPVVLTPEDLAWLT